MRGVVDECIILFSSCVPLQHGCSPSDSLHDKHISKRIRKNMYLSEIVVFCSFFTHLSLSSGQ